MDIQEICKMCGGELEEISDPKYQYKCIYCGKKYKISELRVNNENIKEDDNTKGISPTPNRADGELSGDQVFERVIDSVATIRAVSGMTGGTSSGFLVSSKGFFLTNAHAVCKNDGELFDEISVIVEDRAYKAHPIAVGAPFGTAKGKVADLALLWAEGDFTGHHINKFCNYDEVKNGQIEYIVGNPLGEGIAITSGIVSDKNRMIKGIEHPFLMTDAATNPGNSGGPHYNAKAEIIGVHVAGKVNAEGMNYAVPSNVAEDFLSQVLKHEKLRDVDFGELNFYRDRAPQSTAVIFSGIRLILDIVQYIISFFAK